MCGFDEVVTKVDSIKAKDVFFKTSNVYNHFCFVIIDIANLAKNVASANIGNGEYKEQDYYK